jgi:SAM-dependent methyltransferase
MHVDLYRVEEGYWWSVIQRKAAIYAWSKFSKPVSEYRLLDVGCGAGALLASLSRYAKVYGMDLTREACQFSKRKDIDVFQADVFQLPLKENHFNAVFALDLIEHIENELTALKQIYRVCLGGGIFILTVPAWYCLWGGRDKWLGHKRRYTVSKLKAIVEDAGFEVLHCSYIHILLFPILYFTNKIKQFLRQGRIKTDIASVPNIINLFLIYLFTAETKLFFHIKFPLGTSIICVAKKCQ